MGTLDVNAGFASGKHFTKDKRFLWDHKNKICRCNLLLENGQKKNDSMRPNHVRSAVVTNGAMMEEENLIFPIRAVGLVVFSQLASAV